MQGLVHGAIFTRGPKDLKSTAIFVGGSDVSAGLIFSTHPERMWETAIRRLGADPAALQMSRGVH